MRQGIKRTGFLTGRHQKLARTFRCRRHEQWGFDFDETLILHRRTNGRVDAGPQAQVALHAFATHVEISELQSNVFVNIIGSLVDGKRWRLSRIQHRQRAISELNFASRQVGVHRAGGARRHRASDLHDPFAAGIGTVVNNTLCDAREVTQIDECEFVAMLATARHPTCQGHRGTDMGCIEFATEVGAQGGGCGHTDVVLQVSRATLGALAQ